MMNKKQENKPQRYAACHYKCGADVAALSESSGWDLASVTRSVDRSGPWARLAAPGSKPYSSQAPQARLLKAKIADMRPAR